MPDDFIIDYDICQKKVPALKKAVLEMLKDHAGP